MFSVGWIVHNNTLTVTFLSYFLTSRGNLCKMSGLNWASCSLVYRILLGPVMGLLKYHRAENILAQGTMQVGTRETFYHKCHFQEMEVNV